jgi:serine/threonine protein kinase
MGGGGQVEPDQAAMSGEGKPPGNDGEGNGDAKAKANASVSVPMDTGGAVRHASSEPGGMTGMEDYEVIKPIGKGKFAVVYRARRKADDAIVALKKISVDAMDAKVSRASRARVVGDDHHHPMAPTLLVLASDQCPPPSSSPRTRRTPPFCDEFKLPSSDPRPTPRRETSA